ncbi:MAG: NAD-dependent succinate-semialdehyde dehydrogenase [Devosia sp.]|uniref:NAD-dependent succinate-semialdehyde dehydrogenase n=1 Tax=Devosia sp. TaxID=1871048 RepID=UPI002623A282|nr:NAD-dependent succinate-semialdehyde dehydrogenase [Devosia sp.]MDB5538596.1 NAD-dependent succinate-semialdehyde dehydrogenase [Devosia sp.]
MSDTKLFIDGVWRDGAAGKRRDVTNPATGETIGTVALAEPSDLDDALAAAARGFAAWRSVSAYQRAAILRRAAQTIRADAAAIVDTIVTEQGKPVAEAKIEAGSAADILDWAAGEAQRLYGWTIPSRQAGVVQTAVREPVGPVAAFTPWNFPLNQPTRKLASALAAGCSVVLKASEETPASAAVMVRALAEAGAPAGVLNLVFGDGRIVSRHLITSSIIRKVSFTGSTPVGRQIAALAGEQLKRLTLELGGHAPVLVFEDAEIGDTVARTVAAKFRNSGQVCTSPTRFLVARQHHESFAAQFADAASKLVVGDGADPQTQVGPLTNERRILAIERLVADAVARGARLLAGGRRAQRPGRFYEPTVLADVPLEAEIMTEEPFGPVAIINPFDTVEDALLEANRVPFGLAAYAYSKRTTLVNAALAGLEAGMVSVNHHGLAQAETPFGGVKESGFGTEGGAEMLDAYTVTKFQTVLA